MDRSVLYCGIVYLHGRLGKELPDMWNWSMNDLKGYVEGLEQELIKANYKCKGETNNGK